MKYNIMYVIMVHVHVGILGWEMKLASNTHLHNLYVIMVHVHVGICNNGTCTCRYIELGNEVSFKYTYT